MNKKYLVLGDAKSDEDAEGKWHTYIEVISEVDMLEQAVGGLIKHGVGGKIAKIIDWKAVEKDLA